MSDIGLATWFVIGLVWLIGAFGSSAIIAALYKRLHPDLAFYKLWAVWAIVVSMLAAGVFAFGPM